MDGHAAEPITTVAQAVRARGGTPQDVVSPGDKQTNGQIDDRLKRAGSAACRVERAQIDPFQAVVQGFDRLVAGQAPQGRSMPDAATRRPVRKREGRQRARGIGAVCVGCALVLASLMHLVHRTRSDHRSDAVQSSKVGGDVVGTGGPTWHKPPDTRMIPTVPVSRPRQQARPQAKSAVAGPASRRLSGQSNAVSKPSQGRAQTRIAASQISGTHGSHPVQYHPPDSAGAIEIAPIH